MAESTQTAGTPTTPTGYGWCAWHGGFADEVRVIRIDEQGSGARGYQMACPPCRDAHQLVPLADRP